MKKRFINLLLCTTLLVLLLPASAVFAGTYPTGGGYLTYEITDGEVTITKYTPPNHNYEGSVVIPDTIEGYPVTRIGTYAFNIDSLYSYYKLSIQLSDNIKVIEGGAFFSPESELTINNLPPLLTYVGSSAFRNSYLKTSYLPDTLQYIGEFAFYFCGLSGTLTPPHKSQK